jgi:hypothetical protein
LEATLSIIAGSSLGHDISPTILDTPGVFDIPDARAEFIAHYFAHTPDIDDFWDEAWHHICHAIAMFLNMPTTQSEVKKCCCLRSTGVCLMNRR